MPPTDNPDPPSRGREEPPAPTLFQRPPNRLGFALAVIFLIAVGGASVFALKLRENDPPPPPGPIHVDKTPIRGEFQPLRLRRTGFTYRCTECHNVFDSGTVRKQIVAEHEDLVLDHGRNDFCINCHHRTNRDAYAAFDGGEIPADSPAELCGQCHGLIHRDWKAGVHGRRQGRWDGKDGGKEQLLCIQCHDPHAPQFPQMEPLPGPRPR